MNLSRNDLKKIQYEFNSWSNRLLQADFNDYLDVLTKYISFLNQTPIIMDYISGCGDSELDVAKEVAKVQKGYGRCIFETGNSETEEVRNVYAILKYLIDHKINIPHAIALGYSYSKNYQDMIKGFNNRFVMVLIRHIEKFLTKVGIDMGIDETKVYNVTVQNGQAIFAGDNSTVTATNTIGVDANELSKLIDAVKNCSSALLNEERETVTECIEVIGTEAVSAKPKKAFLKTALNTLKAIKGTAEFAAAVTALIQFFAPVIG